MERNRQYELIDLEIIKLSVAQKNALKKLDIKKQSSYQMQVSISTLNALVNLGLVNKKSESGYMWSPQTCITWSLTKKGNKVKEDLNGKN